MGSIRCEASLSTATCESRISIGPILFGVLGINCLVIRVSVPLYKITNCLLELHAIVDMTRK